MRPRPPKGEVLSATLQWKSWPAPASPGGARGQGRAVKRQLPCCERGAAGIQAEQAHAVPQQAPEPSHRPSSAVATGSRWEIEARRGRSCSMSHGKKELKSSPLVFRHLLGYQYGECSRFPSFASRVTLRETEKLKSRGPRGWSPPAHCGICQRASAAGSDACSRCT